jgi:fluoride exporter
MAQFLLVCLGGAAGTGARYLLSSFFLRVAGPSFPYGTLAVNLIGSFLLGFILQTALATDLLSPTARVTLATGVMGGFTTYSSFNYETLRLWQSGVWQLAALNVVFTLVGCLVAGLLGQLLARWCFGS